MRWFAILCFAVVAASVRAAAPAPEPASKTPPAAAPATAPSGTTAPTTPIDRIRTAETPSAAVEAYARAVAGGGVSDAVQRAYIRRMVDFGVPEMGESQAQDLNNRGAADGMSLGVIAYAAASRGDIATALRQLKLALERSPDDFVLRTAGQMVAWYDMQTDRSAFTLADKDTVEWIRSNAKDKKVFADAYRLAASQPRGAAPEESSSGPAVIEVPPAGAHVYTSPADVAYPPYYYPPVRYGLAVYTNPFRHKSHHHGGFGFHHGNRFHHGDKFHHGDQFHHGDKFHHRSPFHGPQPWSDPHRGSKHRGGGFVVGGGSHGERWREPSNVTRLRDDEHRPWGSEPVRSPIRDAHRGGDRDGSRTTRLRASDQRPPAARPSPPPSAGQESRFGARSPQPNRGGDGNRGRQGSSGTRTTPLNRDR